MNYRGTTRVWEIQRRLLVREPVLGGSRLLEELAPAVS
jgi:hypothetical protein